MTKVYERTEDGATTRVTVREALAEVNRAQMESKRDVRRMSSGRTRHDIEYKDGRHVVLVLVDEPETADRFAAHCIPAAGGKVHTATPDSVDGEAFPFCRTGGQDSRGTFYALTSAPLTCRTCLTQERYRKEAIARAHQ